MDEEKMICNCGFKADDTKKFEQHIDTCIEVGTDEWEANTTK